MLWISPSLELSQTTSQIRNLVAKQTISISRDLAMNTLLNKTIACNNNSPQLVLIPVMVEDMELNRTNTRLGTLELMRKMS